MIKEVGIRDVANLQRSLVHVDNDFILSHILGDVNSTTHLMQSQFVRLTDVMVAFLEEGEIEGFINGEPFKLTAGEVLLISNAVIAPSTFLHSQAKGHVLYMTRRFVADSVPQSALMQSALYCFDRDFMILRLEEAQIDSLRLYSGLYGHHLNQASTINGREIVRMLTKCVLCELIDMMAKNVPSERREVGRSERIVIGFLDLLSAGRPRSRFIDEYATELCVSAKHLSEVCKQVTGRTALQWITEYIVRDVRYYLLYTDMSIKEIVFQLNFPNSSFFGKYVKTHLGMSPREFRKSAGGDGMKIKE